MRALVVALFFALVAVSAVSSTAALRAVWGMGAFCSLDTPAVDNTAVDAEGNFVFRDASLKRDKKAPAAR